MKKYALFSIVFFASVLLDQISKIWVVKNIKGPVEAVPGINILEKHGVTMKEWVNFPSEIPVIEGFFSIVHTQNAGAAFGIMQGQMWVFAIFTLIALGVIVWTLVQLPSHDRFQNFALALLASGTVGNGIDRMHKRSVTDFLHVYSDNPKLKPILIDVLGSTAWPSFNIADAAIVVGMIMFGIFYVFLEKDEEDQGENIEDADMVEGIS